MSELSEGGKVRRRGMAARTRIEVKLRGRVEMAARKRITVNE